MAQHTLLPLCFGPRPWSGVGMRTSRHSSVQTAGRAFRYAEQRAKHKTRVLGNLFSWGFLKEQLNSRGAPWRQRLNRCPSSPFCLVQKQQLRLHDKCVTIACWVPGASSPARSLLPTAPVAPPSILGPNSYLSGGDAALIVWLVCQQERDTAMRLCTLLRDI